MSSNKSKKKNKNKRVHSFKPNHGHQTHMTPEEKTAQEAAGLIPERDDFQAIGIEPECEVALNDIGIMKYSEILQYSAEGLAKVLSKRSGYVISSAVIASQDWIGRAKKLYELNKKAEPLKETEPKTEVTTENAETYNSKPKKTVEQQDSIIEKNQPENISEGDAFTIEHTATSVEPAPVKPNHAVESNKPVELKITEVKIHPSDLPGSADSVDETTLRAEITARLKLKKGYALPETGLPVCAQVHAINTTTGAPKLLAFSSLNYQNGKSDVNINLDFTAPAVGRYKLQVVLLLLDAEPAIALHEGPFLRVEE